MIHMSGSWEFVTTAPLLRLKFVVSLNKLWLELCAFQSVFLNITKSPTFHNFGAFLCRKNTNLFKFPKYMLRGDSHFAWDLARCLGAKNSCDRDVLVIPFMQNVAVRAEMPGGFLPLPTFPLECGHFSPNVGKYTIHGSYGRQFEIEPNKKHITNHRLKAST